MRYTSGSHTVFHHRYHIVWITKYRYKVLNGALRERIRTIISGRPARNGRPDRLRRVVAGTYVHMSVEIPPHTAVSDFVGASRDAPRIGCRWSSRICASATGGGISGLGATSPPPAAISRTMSYFSIVRSTNLPASAGGYSVLLRRSQGPLVRSRQHHGFDLAGLRSVGGRQRFAVLRPSYRTYQHSRGVAGHRHRRRQCPCLPTTARSIGASLCSRWSTRLSTR